MSTIFDSVSAWLKKRKPMDATELVRIKPEIFAFIENIIEKGTHNPFTSTPYMNFRETDGSNRSKDIDPMILRNGGQLGQSYCLWGIQDILRATEKSFDLIFDLPKTGGVVKFWEATKAEYKSRHPKKFYIACYQTIGASTGHAALSFGPINDKEFATFEFNTNPEVTDEIISNGQGCYYKTRKIQQIGSMKLLGFVDIFEAIKK